MGNMANVDEKPKLALKREREKTMEAPILCHTRKTFRVSKKTTICPNWVAVRYADKLLVDNRFRQRVRCLLKYGDFRRYVVIIYQVLGQLTYVLPEDKTLLNFYGDS